MHHARRTLIATLLVAAFAATARAQPGIGTCVMGETRLATGGLNGLWTFGLRVYQWFDPATCGFCLAADGAIVLRTVELDVFPASHQASPVEIPAAISVVGWKGLPSCPEPDDANVIMPPQDVTFVVPASPLTRLSIRVPIAGSPQFLLPAFLELVIPPAPVADASQSPAVGEVVSLTCPSCRQYQDLGLLPGLADACSGGGHDPLTIRPRGDCVAVTAARSATWGRLKSIYR